MCSGRAQLPIIVVESLSLNHFEAMMSILQAPAIAVRSEDKFEASCYILISFLANKIIYANKIISVLCGSEILLQFDV